MPALHKVADQMPCHDQRSTPSTYKLHLEICMTEKGFVKGDEQDHSQQ